MDTRSLGEKFRLLPSQVNLILRRLVQKEEADGVRVEKKQMLVSSKSTTEQTVDYFILHKTFGLVQKKIAILLVAKDSETKENEKELPSACDIEKKFHEENPEGGFLMLLPMRMCRGFYGLPLQVNIPFFGSYEIPKVKRRHIVLTTVEIPPLDAVEQKHHIQVLDSQAKGVFVVYLDKWQEKGDAYLYNPDVDYLAYAQQFDNIKCGFYVLMYLASILKHGDASHCADINVISGDKPDGEPLYPNTLYLGSTDKMPFIFSMLTFADAHHIQEMQTIMGVGRQGKVACLERFLSEKYRPTQKIDTSINDEVLSFDSFDEESDDTPSSLMSFEFEDFSEPETKSAPAELENARTGLIDSIRLFRRNSKSLGDFGEYLVKNSQ